jgi:dihydrofolate synthase / folylpolyglutamate synthase
MSHHHPTDGTGFDAAYLSSVDEIYHYGWSTRKLLRIRMLEKSIRHFWPEGHPTRLAHIAGTNGKGSTCRLFEAALSNHGVTGAMVNPHLFDYAERFNICGNKVRHSDVSSIWKNILLPHSLDRAEKDVSHALTFAEAGILIALHLFDQYAVRWAIIETGVGGRYAPTMAIDPEICLLTNIGNDHPHTLGSSSWQVALEKAGITRDQRILLTTAADEHLEYIRSVADEKGGRVIQISNEEQNDLRQKITGYKDSRLIQGNFAPGDHWYKNASLALQTALRFEPDLDLNDAIPRMAAMSRLPGRFWQKDENLIVDVAHNPDKLAVLANDLKSKFPDRKYSLVFGVSRNRDINAMLAPFKGLISSIIFTSASYAGRDPQDLFSEFDSLGFNIKVNSIENPEKALDHAINTCINNDLIVLTGSAYTIDQALNPDSFLKKMNAEFGRRGGIC